MPENIEQIVIEILAHRKTFDPADVNPDVTLASLGIDSLEGLEIIFALEDRFDISISDEAVKQMKTVSQVVAGVRRLVCEPRSTTP
jgi:acyl carrier protein